MKNLDSLHPYCRPSSYKWGVRPWITDSLFFIHVFCTSKNDGLVKMYLVKFHQFYILWKLSRSLLTLNKSLSSINEMKTGGNQKHILNVHHFHCWKRHVYCLNYQAEWRVHLLPNSTNILSYCHWYCFNTTV